MAAGKRADSNGRTAQGLTDSAVCGGASGVFATKEVPGDANEPLRCIDLTHTEAKLAAGGSGGARHTESALVNFGGDLAVSRPRRSGLPWRVGVETPRADDQHAARMIDLRQGALATSGDTYRYVARDGKRYTHILDPRTGYPVENAPRSVTVAASTCTQAGMLTTLSLLRGADAERFLQGAGAQFWVQR
jgi:hypothetical protein